MFIYLLLAISFLGTEAFRAGRQIAHSPYIIGGQDVDPVGKYPFQVSLYLNGFGHFCGGVLISDEFVLTAAHCTIGAFGISILVGAYDVQTLEEGNPTFLEVDYFYEHEDYNPFTLDHDISIGHLATPADLTDEFVETIALAPSDAPDYVGYECYIIGWGTTEVYDDGSYDLPNILQEAQIEVMPNDQCDEIYEIWGGVDETKICVGVTDQSGACFGDSGGPTFCNVDGVMTHTGVASYVYDEFCTVEAPTVYTRTSIYRDWIEENTGV